MSGNNLDGVTVMVDVSQRGIDEELNQTMAEYVNFFYKSIDTGPTVSAIENILKTKRGRNPVLTDYLDSLTVNTAYFIETINAYTSALQVLISNGTRDSEIFASQFQEINEQFRNSTDHLPKYRAGASTDKEECEYTYIFYSVYHSAYIEAAGSLFANPGYFDFFKGQKIEDVGQLFKDYHHACTLRLLAQPTATWVVPD